MTLNQLALIHIIYFSPFTPCAWYTRDLYRGNKFAGGPTKTGGCHRWRRCSGGPVAVDEFTDNIGHGDLHNIRTKSRVPEKNAAKIILLTPTTLRINLHAFPFFVLYIRAARRLYTPFQR